MATRLKRTLKAASMAAVGQKYCYRFRCNLVGSSPAVWRRVQLAGDDLLSDLHTTLQEEMGWTSEYPNRFEINGDVFVPEEPEGWTGRQIYDHGIMMIALRMKRGQQIKYRYDSPEQPQFHILLEDIVPVEPGEDIDRVIDGEGMQGTKRRRA
jgi:hypothetical protein